jgi:luciferase family oxidoreductase group 1
MNDLHPVQLSVLDVGLAHLTPHLARRVEELGYARYWISEHHGEGGISNPTLLVPLVAGMTKRLRVGTAVILLRFQSPLAVAENFRTLSRLFPGRIDLGVGRAAAATPAQARALHDGRAETYTAADHEAKVTEVQRLVTGRLASSHPLANESIDPPLPTAGPPALWVHSTSAEGARLAARLGAHYSFHHHYNPTAGAEAVRLYEETFVASPELSAPHWTVCVAGYCGEDDADVEDVVARHYSGLPAGRHLVQGGMDVWGEALAAIADVYRTREIVVQTLGGAYDLARQIASFARVAEAARGVS